MSRRSILNRFIRTVASTAVFISLLSPAHASARLPWPAPVGHRQPHRADVPQSAAASAWERQQQRFDQELDRRLVICRGC